MNLRVFSGPVATIVAYVLVPFLVLDFPETTSGRGLALFAADRIGAAAAVVIVGSLGLLYRANRTAGWFVGCIVAAILMEVGNFES